MAAVSNPIRFGSNDALATPTYSDLYLPVFGGEVMTRFNEYLGVTAKVKRTTIATGNTARFPRLGGIGAERHAVGTKLLGLDSEQTEVSITLDERPLVSHFRLDDVDQAMSHFEIRSEMALQAGQALAEAQDRYTLRLLINASRATATTLYGGSGSQFPGGGLAGDGVAATGSVQATVTTRPDGNAVGAFLDLLDQIIERWDSVRVPFAGRHVYCNVPMWHGIRQFGAPRNATQIATGQYPMFQNANGVYGNNSNPGQFLSQMADFNTAIQFNGLEIWRTNLMPSTDLSSDDEAKYQGNFTATRAICFQTDAAAVAVKMGVMSKSQEDISRGDHLFVSRMLSGGGTLRPECAVEITHS